LLLLAGSASRAQAATVALGEASAVSGQTGVALPLSLTVSAGELVSALVFDVHFDATVAQWQSVVPEPAVSALGKQVETHVVAPGHIRLVVYGLNRQVLADGVIAQCLLGVRSSAAPGSSLVSLRDGLGTNPDGQDLPLTVFDGRLWIDVPADTTPPTLTLTSPSEGARFTQGTSVTVAGTATDDRPGVQVTVNGTAVSLSTAGSFSYALSGLSAGTQTITILAVDAAGNRRELTRSVTVEAAASTSTTTSTVTLTVLSPLSESTVGNPVYLKFTVTGVDLRSGTQYAHVHIRLDGGEVWHVYNNQPFLLGKLAPGTHTVTVMLADNVNHYVWPGTKMKRVTFTVK
jgi:hypothetical protein